MNITLNKSEIVNIFADQHLRSASGRIGDLFACEQDWTQGAEARNEQGHPVDPFDERATRFCVSGAFLRKMRPDAGTYRLWLTVAERAVFNLSGRKDGLFAYNDDPTTSTSDIVCLLDEIDRIIDVGNDAGLEALNDNRDIGAEPQAHA